MKKIILFTLLIISILSCRKENKEIICNGSNNDFSNLYNHLLSSGFADETTMDLEIHQFYFQLSQEMEICKIGYQSQTEIENNPYLIEIIDTTNNITLLSESHTFSSNSTSYFAPSNSVKLDTSIVYLLRRTQTNWENFSNIIGRMATNNSISFPYKNGVITVLGSKFYQMGGPFYNCGIPFIDIVFK